MPSFDLSPNGVRQLIAGGESPVVEFKERVPSQDVVARNLAAFANSDGGILLCGVRDDAEIVGIPQSDVEEAVALLKRVAGSLLSWTTTVGAVDVGGKYVVYAVVDKSPRPYYPVSTSRGEYFKRIGAESRQVPSSDLFPVRSVTVPTTALPESTVVLFVAMSFREEEEPALVDYFAAMKRAVKNSGLPFEIKRMDLVDGDYEISQKIMDEIERAQIVLADFTLNPSNVYFEIGYARGLRKRIIQTARKKTALEFDVRNWKTIFYRNATELEEKLLPELKAAYNEVRETS
jgi:hypothetical protein